MTSIAIASLFLFQPFGFYTAFKVFKENKLDKEDVLNESREVELKLNIKKSDVKLDLYDYVFPELLKQRYMKERNKTEEEYKKSSTSTKRLVQYFCRKYKQKRIL